VRDRRPGVAEIPGLVFTHDEAVARSSGIARQLTRAGLLTREDCAHAERLLAHQQRTPMIVNNGDFYPRNLIVQTMWGNRGWQAAYRNALQQRFGFSTASFAKGVVIAALELASMWINDTDLHLAASQASTITSMLRQAGLIANSRAGRSS
jgi:hypothetical protein